ncbi:MAG: Na+/H+ antiporter NhaC [Candidatus Hydrogenedentes bacterium]|nr:Na+/H+ antiporter NhaC [Candidatus Hydrogenedentota bacterium]
MTSETQRPGLALSVIPVIVLMSFLIVNVRTFGDSATAGPNQLALFLAAALAACIGHFVLKLEYKTLELRAIHSIGLAMQANLILLVVGALIGLWIQAGIVPTLVYYGVKLLHPTSFLAVACGSCCMISLAVGSSWSTMGTLGVALITIGAALGIPTPMVAGAIVSGAYFGDKLSPLSDTTNLAPAIAGTDLFTHVRHMLYTTIPAISLALLGYALLGFAYGGKTYDPALVLEVQEVLLSHFSIGIHTLIAPAVVLVLVLRKMPALPALTVGALLGAAEALLFQSGNTTQGMTGIYTTLITTAHSGYTLESGNAIIDDLLSKGGMLGMLNTVLLIIMAMLFGGMMEATGMLRRIAASILSLVRGTGSLIGATIGTCIFFNITAAEQYLAIVVPGRMYREAYEEYGLDPRNLSRALEDGGTVTSVLVPWNTCGAYASSVLGVATFDYLPWCFFNLCSPVISTFMAAMHWAIKMKAEDTLENSGT